MAPPGVPPNAHGMPVAPPDSTFVATVKYVYFMRFSIMLWLFFPIFAALDWSGALSAMSRGIVALESWQHLVLAGFFVTMAGWIALLSARIVCAYGQDRFDCPPPWYFEVKETRKMSWWAFWLAQIPGFLLLTYVGHATYVEQGDKKDFSAVAVAAFLLLGVIFALLCWTLMTGIYYWMFWRPGSTAKPFLVPYAKLFSNIESCPPSSPLVGLLQLFERAAKLGPGYAENTRGMFKLHSGHAFAFLTLGFLAAVYVAFWHYTAPIELSNVRLMARIVFIIGAIVWTILSLRARHVLPRPAGKWYTARMIVLFAPLLYMVSLPFWSDNKPFAMPVLSFVTVLLTFVFWGLGGLAFYFDRFRVPVLASVVAVLVLFNLAFGKLAGTDEHYITSFDFSTNGPNALKEPVLPPKLTPGEILGRFEAGNAGMGKPRPVIIVTATGGGIHAAMWTSTALNEIEKQFGSHPDLKATTFHDSILMISTVSGGSVGVAPWLSHYLDGSDFKNDADMEITGCSDLQAAAWGLVYADFLRVLFPFRFSSLGKTLNTYDRGWALEQAFGRNRKAKCDPNQFHRNPFDIKEDKRISDFDLESHPGRPAFSLNTTAEETGARFVIGNYDVKPESDKSEITPTHSFVPYFQQDLPLSTAARLSANFPYVSPMPRLKPFEDPKDKDNNRRNYHFGDGGYFDNDGTASAMEFLWYALRKRPDAGAKLPVLIVEIRDGDDPSGVGDPDPANKAWPGQTLGPLSTFYNANHVSVTRRNRRELCFMEKALKDKAEFTHIVLPFSRCRPGDAACWKMPDKQALSWHLTGDQKLQMHTAIDNVKDQIAEIASWYAHPVPGPADPEGCYKWEPKK
jgi:hypothetical protein